MNLLVIDWDFFFPTGEHDVETAALWDWGHSEEGMAALYLGIVWTTRAADFIRRGIALPDTSGEEAMFWSRFTFAPNAKLYYGESNVLAYHKTVRRGWNLNSQVWLFDAHHDSGGYRYTLAQTLKRKTLTCEDWMVGYAATDLHMRYPRWKAWGLTEEPDPIVRVDRRVDDGADVPVVFDRVFVCRSGAWVPPWLDQKFWAFIASAPVPQRQRRALDNIVALDAQVRSLYQQEQAEKIAKDVQMLINNHQGGSQS